MARLLTGIVSAGISSEANQGCQFFDTLDYGPIPILLPSHEIALRFDLTLNILETNSSGLVSVHFHATTRTLICVPVVFGLAK